MGFLFSKEEPATAEMVQVVSEKVDEKPQNRVLVIGGAYAGLSAVIHLLELANGGEHRPTSVTLPPVTGKPLRTSVQITMVDERDGFCKYRSDPVSYLIILHEIYEIYSYTTKHRSYYRIAARVSG